MATKSVLRQVDGMTKQLGTGLAQGEAHLPLAVEVDDRVLDGAETGQGDGQHDGVDPGRELPRHDRSGRDAHVVEAGGDPLDPVTELAEGDRLAVGGDEQGMVRRQLRSAVDQLPHGAGAGEYIARGHDPPSGTTLIAAGGGGAGWRTAPAVAGQGRMVAVARPPVHSEPDLRGGTGAATRRRSIAGTSSGWSASRCVGILLGWFALANIRKVQIDFWVFHRQAPLIVVILISGLLGALITFLIMRRKAKPRRSRSRPQGGGPAARPGRPRQSWARPGALIASR